MNKGLEQDSMPPVQPGAAPSPQGDYSAVRIPVLISGIFNCLAALGLVWTCFLSPLAAPLVVLAVFEFKLFAKLGQPGVGPAEQSRAKTLGICGICTILLGNLGSFVCGIITLVNAKTLPGR